MKVCPEPYEPLGCSFCFFSFPQNLRKNCAVNLAAGLFYQNNSSHTLAYYILGPRQRLREHCTIICGCFVLVEGCQARAAGRATGAVWPDCFIRLPGFCL